VSTGHSARLPMRQALDGPAPVGDVRL